MNTGKFIASINDSVNLLARFKLFKALGSKGYGNCSEEFIKLSKKNNIVEMYECAIRNIDYDILLHDDSIIQFQKNQDNLRYAYIQNPFKFISKEEYVVLTYDIEELEMYSDLTINELVDETLYEQFLNEQILNSTANYFRYDCSPIGYKALVHSHSHFHIGLNENVRIPTSKIITPLKFVKFCIKNTYYDTYKKYLEENPKFLDEIVGIKKQCIDLDAINWDMVENNDLYLS